MDSKSKCLFTYESDDDELPSLSLRIQNACKLKTDIEEITPCVIESTLSSKSEDESNFLVHATIESSPNCNYEVPPASESAVLSESEDESQFLKFLEKVKATPRCKRSPLALALNFGSDSDDDYPFHLAKPAENYFTPMPHKRSVPVQISASVERHPSNRLKGKHSKLSPTSKCVLQPNALNKHKTTPENRGNMKPTSLNSDSEDESEFLKFLQVVRQTPCSVKKPASGQILASSQKYPSNVLKENNSEPSPASKKVPQPKPQSNLKGSIENRVKIRSSLSSDSEDESEFIKFVETIRQTPHSVKKKHLSPAVKNSPNDSVSNVIKSLKKIQTSNTESRSLSTGSSSDCPEKMRLFASSCSPKTKKLSPSWFNGVPVSKSWTAPQKENAEKYSKLFSGEPKLCKSFPLCRDIVAKKLYSFFNKTVFESKLPEDIPLIWSNRLTNSAGIFCVKSNSSLIQLSLPYLTSLDRLQDTLIHEMCHAAVYFISKQRRECHGPLWQIWASRCNLILPFIKCPERCHNYDIVK